MKLDTCRFVTTTTRTDEDGFEEVVNVISEEYPCEEKNLSTSLKIQGVKESIELAALLIVNQDDYEEAGKPELVQYEEKTYKVFNTRKLSGRNVELTLREQG